MSNGITISVSDRKNEIHLFWNGEHILCIKGNAQESFVGMTKNRALNYVLGYHYNEVQKAVVSAQMRQYQTVS